LVAILNIKAKLFQNNHKFFSVLPGTDSLASRVRLDISMHVIEWQALVNTVLNAEIQ
jgi:hypothetical protein